MRDENTMYDILVDSLGYEGAFNALWQALSIDEQIENYDYISRIYDFPSIVDEEEDEY